jgi:2'-5' RNA ligase
VDTLAFVEVKVGRTAVVVTVPAAENLVGQVRSQFDPAASVGVPAHVTVLYPWLDLDAVTDADLAGLGEICADVPAFDVTFARFGRFPGVLWLDPEPAAPFVALTEAVARRWPQAPPYGGVHDAVTPHLTVMDVQEAGTDDDAQVAQVVTSLAAGLPVRQRVDEVSLLVFGGTSFTTVARLPLGGA